MLEGRDGGITKNRVSGLSRKRRTQNTSLVLSRQLHFNHQRVHLGGSSRSAQRAKVRKTETRSGKKNWKESESGTPRREFKRSKSQKKFGNPEEGSTDTIHPDHPPLLFCLFLSPFFPLVFGLNFACPVPFLFRIYLEILENDGGARAGKGSIR